jgi:uncharacterized protein
MAVELPLFPLGTVLFPHMPLGLHIFEPRYRQMLRDCERAGTSFGVLAIREGSEVGYGAVPYQVGTLAQIREREQLPDGRYQLSVAGASRFRVVGLSRTRPYLTGTVEYLQDGAASPDDASRLAATLAREFRRYVLAVRGQGKPVEDLDLPEEPELLAYLVAASLPVSTPNRQSLLEVDHTEDRLRGCIRLLQREQTFLDRMLTRPDRIAAISRN